MALEPPATGYHYRDALRLLFILDAGSAPAPDGEPPYSKTFNGEKRLLAIDFLVRYPDYLADALLDLHEQTPDPQLLKVVAGIFDADEPDVRVVKMIRWKRGAYNKLGTALSILSCRGLIKTEKRSLSGGRQRFEFRISDTVPGFLAAAVHDHSSLDWYRKRTELAMRVAKGASGSALKDQQYKHPEYKSTDYGATIPSIKNRVIERLLRVQGQDR